MEVYLEKINNNYSKQQQRKSATQLLVRKCTSLICSCWYYNQTGAQAITPQVGLTNIQLRYSPLTGGIFMLTRTSERNLRSRSLLPQIEHTINRDTISVLFINKNAGKVSCRSSYAKQPSQDTVLASLLPPLLPVCIVPSSAGTCPSSLARSIIESKWRRSCCCCCKG